MVHSGSEVRAELKVGRILGSELHPVANPVLDSLGNLYVTFSGSRGEKAPVSIFVFYPDGSRHPFLADIINPTGIVIGPDDCLYITSRHNSTVYRSTLDKQVEKYSEGLGLATGLAFDSKGNLLVGDRSGTIYKVTPQRELSVFCEFRSQCIRVPSCDGFPGSALCDRAHPGDTGLHLPGFAERRGGGVLQGVRAPPGNWF